MLFWIVTFQVFRGFVQHNTETVTTVQIERLPVFFKQRDNFFFPAWTFVIPTTLMRLPVSFVESLVYTVITYFEIDLAPTAGR